MPHSSAASGIGFFKAVYFGIDCICNGNNGLYSGCSVVSNSETLEMHFTHQIEIVENWIHREPTLST